MATEVLEYTSYSHGANAIYCRRLLVFRILYNRGFAVLAAGSLKLSVVISSITFCTSGSIQKIDRSVRLIQHSVNGRAGLSWLHDFQHPADG